jgi:aryl-phospho-beta-D-glucosidase BglC (GH1 family)
MNGKVFGGLPDWVGTSQDAYNRGVEAIGQDMKKLQSRLEDLWSNYVPECDFALMAQWGVNTIRLPLGYWNLGPQHVKFVAPFEKFSDAYVNSLDYVRRIVLLAEKYGIGVLLDLHGAPGSQNGADHSGVSGPTDLYNRQENMDVGVDALVKYAQFFKNHTNIVGIELLNEPREHANLQTFYKTAYSKIRAIDATIPIYLCDTVWSSNLNKWADFIVNNNWEFATLDAHKYYAFNGGGTPADNYPGSIRGWDKSQVSGFQSSKVNIVIGEWSNALNPGSYNGYDQGRRDRARRELGAAQLEAWATGAGFHMWSWKTDFTPDVSDWDFKALNTAGWFPSNYNQYNIATSKCDSALRESMVAKLVAGQPARRQTGVDGHRAYWMRTAPNAQYDWDRYTDGFNAGYEAGIKFFSYMNSRIVMKRDLALLRRKQYEATRTAAGLSNANTWQFRDGVLEGIAGFETSFRAL